MRKSTFKLQLPKAWPAQVRSAMIHVVSLAKYAAVYTRSWAANSPNARVRLKAENDRLQEEVALLRAEIGIKDARMKCLAPHRRPYYPPPVRLESLELRAARGWSLQQTADAFLVSPKTVASWMARLDESGPQALVQLRTPVNKFPDFVRYAVQQLQALCPTLGKHKLAQVLARAGLHLGTTTIGRIRKENPVPVPPSAKPTPSATRKVTAKRPNHVWHIDLTTVATQSPDSGVRGSPSPCRNVGRFVGGSPSSWIITRDASWALRSFVVRPLQWPFAPSWDESSTLRDRRRST